MNIFSASASRSSSSRHRGERGGSRTPEGPSIVVLAKEQNGAIDNERCFFRPNRRAISSIHLRRGPRTRHEKTLGMAGNAPDGEAVYRAFVD
jgi:hypothetical protein